MTNPPFGGFGILQLDLLAPSMAFALRAVGCADVRFGILPSQSRLRGDDVLAKALDPVSPHIHVLHGMKSS